MGCRNPAGCNAKSLGMRGLVRGLALAWLTAAGAAKAADQQDSGRDSEPVASEHAGGSGVSAATGIANDRAVTKRTTNSRADHQVAQPA
jgi:hypothetical protein